jgi:hypothetical protein
MPPKHFTPPPGIGSITPPPSRSPWQPCPSRSNRPYLSYFSSSRPHRLHQPSQSPTPQIPCQSNHHASQPTQNPPTKTSPSRTPAQPPIHPRITSPPPVPYPQAPNTQHPALDERPTLRYLPQAAAVMTDTQPEFANLVRDSRMARGSPAHAQFRAQLPSP